jgi:hypothetical protein
MAKNKDLTIITIHSDEIDATLLKSIKKQFKKNLKGRKIAVFAVGKEDGVSVNTIKG